jgi:serine protease AprX
VAGIVGGDALESTGSQYLHTFRGIAPNVKLINLRVLDLNGAGQDSSVIAAIPEHK